LGVKKQPTWDKEERERLVREKGGKHVGHLKLKKKKKAWGGGQRNRQERNKKKGIQGFCPKKRAEFCHEGKKQGTYGKGKKVKEKAKEGKGRDCDHTPKGKSKTEPNFCTAKVTEKNKKTKTLEEKKRWDGGEETLGGAKRKSENI